MSQFSSSSGELTLELSLASSLAPRMFEEQLTHILSLMVAEGDDADLMAMLTPFIRHQIGTNSPSAEHIKRLLAWQTSVILKATTASRKDLLYCGMRSLSVIILWIVCDGDLRSELNTEALKSIAPVLQSNLQLADSDDDFDLYFEALCLEKMVLLVNESSRSIQAEIKILKMTLPSSASDKLSELYLSVSKKLQPLLKKCNIKDGTDWFAEYFLLRVIHMYSFELDKAYAAFALLVESRIHEFWQLPMCAVDCVRETVCHTKSSPWLSLGFRNNCGTDFAKLSTYSRRKIFSFLNSNKYHNWWIRSKVYEALIICIQNDTLEPYREQCHQIITSSTTSEKRDPARLLLSQIGDVRFVQQLRIKFALTSMPLTFEYVLNRAECRAENIPMILSSSSDVTQKRLLADRIMQFSDQPSDVMDAELARLIEKSCQPQSALLLEVILLSALSIFAQRGIVPKAILQKIFECYLLCMKTNGDVISKILSNQFRVYFNPLKVDSSIGTSVLRLIELLNLQPPQLKQLRGFVLSGTPSENEAFAMCLSESAWSREWIFSPQILPTQSDALLMFLSSHLKLPLAVMTSVQASGKLQDAVFLNYIKSFVANPPFYDMSAGRVADAPFPALVLAVLTLLSKYFEGPQESDVLCKRVAQLVDKLHLDDAESVIGTIVSEHTAGRDVSVKVINEWLLLMIDMDDVQTDTTSTATEIVNALRSVATPGVRATLNNLQFRIFELKYPEKDINVLKRDFLSEQFPLEDAELDKYIQMFEKIKEYSFLKNYRNKTLDEMRDLLVAERKKQHVDLHNLKIRVLAMVRQLIFLCKGYYPYNTQILVVIALLHAPLKGRLGQVKTGQGKSIIVTMLASYLSILNFKIDIITTAESLAKRDAKEMAEYFSVFGVTVSHCCNTPMTAGPFRADIVYGTPHSFEWAAIMDEYCVEESCRSPRPYNMVIVDEVDSMFIDKASNNTSLARSNEMFSQISWIYGFLLDTYKSNPGITDIELEHKFVQCSQFLRSSARVQNLLNANKKFWIPNVAQAMSMKPGADYIVDSVEGIRPVDYQHTGEVSVDTKYSNGLHHFLEVKEGLAPQLDSLTGTQLSHIAFFNRYQKIFGLTGTMGGTADRSELAKFYSLDTFNVPVHASGELVCFDPVVVYSDRRWFEAIVDDCNQETSRGRNVLIIFETINETNECLMALGDTPNVKVLNGTQEEDEQSVIADAGKPRAVTIATNLAGRGTDIKTWREAEASGGTHVIIAFFPLNDRVEQQAIGRTARQGKRGTVRFIINVSDEDLPGNLSSKEAIQLMGERREITNAEIARARLIHAPISMAIDQICGKANEKLQIWKDKYHEIEFQGGRQQWEEWFTIMTTRARRLCEDCDIVKVNEFVSEVSLEFDVLIKRLGEQFESGYIIQDPAIMMLMVNEKLEEEDLDEALDGVNYAIKLDPYYSKSYDMGGIVLSALDRKTEAMQMWRNGLSVCDQNLATNPLDVNELTVQVSIHNHLGNVQAAVVAGQKLEQIMKTTFRTTASLKYILQNAGWLSTAGCHRTALSMLDYLIANVSDIEPVALAARAMCHGELGNVDMCLADIRYMCNLKQSSEEDTNTSISQAYETCGQGLTKSEDYIGAWQCANEAVRYSPQRWESYHYRAVFAKKLERFEDARKDYLAAWKLNPDFVLGQTEEGRNYMLGRS